MEPSPVTGGSETTRLVTPRDRGAAAGGLRLKSLFTEPSEPLPEEPKPVEMSFHHCHRDPMPQQGLTPERLQARRQLCAACAVCCVFMAGEVVGGYLAHSLAIMTDAAHLLADVGSMMGSLFSLWLSTRPATRTMTFGWHRSETLGALASVVSLWMVTGILLYLAFIRLLHSDYHIEGGAMLLTASIAVCANLLMAFVLHQAGPPHSHGSRGAEYTPLEEGPREPLPLGNTSVRAAFVHVLGDLLQSLGVLAASILIYFKPQYKAADPISTFLFSIFALGSTAPTLRDVLRVLMEGTPRSVGFEPVRDTLLSVPGVRATHELHLWALTLTYHVASAHLAIGESTLARPVTSWKHLFPQHGPIAWITRVVSASVSVCLSVSLIHRHTYVGDQEP
ncbi:putative proton-coupled zinc antiporter SLC30A3 isoform 1-T1 [Trichechus inunguis]